MSNISQAIETTRVEAITEIEMLRQHLADIASRLHLGTTYSPRRVAKLNDKYHTVQHLFSRLWTLQGIITKEGTDD